MHLEENYTNVKTLLIALKCDQFNWQVIGDFRMVAFLVGLKVDLRYLHVTFAIGIVETQLQTTINEYGQNELNILLGTAKSNGTLLLTPPKYCCFRCTSIWALSNNLLKHWTRIQTHASTYKSFSPRFLKQR